MKAKVTKNDGTVLELEGTAEEIRKVVEEPTPWTSGYIQKQHTPLSDLIYNRPPFTEWVTGALGLGGQCAGT